MKVIIADCDHKDIVQEEEVFNKNGVEYELKQCKTEQDLIDQCKGCSSLITQYGKFTRNVIEALNPDLGQIVRYGVGVDTVDLVAATEAGVQVCNVPDYGMNEVADQAVALMMALVRKVPLIHEYTKNKEWNYQKACPIYRIPGKTIGVFGLGRIGLTFAKRMAGFEVNLIGYDTRYSAGEVVEGIKIVDLDTLLKESDVISIHTPFTPETSNQFNIDAFKKMKKTAYIVNTARGGIINEEDLYVALKDGIIAGAGLDVVAVEPLKVGSKLFELENFLCTPHIAWYSEEAALELKRKVAEEATRFVKGEKVHYPVNTL